MRCFGTRSRVVSEVRRSSIVVLANRLLLQSIYPTLFIMPFLSGNIGLFLILN